MYDNLLTRLRELKFININNKVSPWIERKISDEFREEIINTTSFIEVDVTLSDRIRTMLSGITKQPCCISCNSPTKFHRELKDYARFCSNLCFNQSDEKSANLSVLAKDGKLAIGVNAKKHQHEKYNGVMAIQSKDSGVIEKIKQTCIERYGVDNVSKSDEIKQKISKNATGKHHVYKEINPRHSHLNEYQMELVTNLDILYDTFIKSEIPITIFSKNLGFGSTTVWNILTRNGYDIPVFEPKGYSISKAEKEICFLLDDYNIKHIPQYKIGRKKIDIVIPEFNLAIEYNGLMDHSYGKSDYSRFDTHLEENPNIHLDRLNLCEDNNLELIQIFENEWMNKTKKDIWISIIKNKLKLNKIIYARKCTIDHISTAQLKLFLNENHLQGNCGASVKLGLFYENELVSVMSFGKPRYNKNHGWELIRFCNKKYINVVGGCDKLFKFFLTNYNPSSIISYCDKRVFNGNVYEKLNFTKEKESAPNYFYFIKKEYILHSRNKFQKHKLSKILLSFDSSLTEKENMFNNGYRILYDCGNKIYVWRK